jgi:hypothetical protein
MNKLTMFTQVATLLMDEKETKLQDVDEWKSNVFYDIKIGMEVGFLLFYRASAPVICLFNQDPTIKAGDWQINGRYHTWAQ